MFKIKFKNFDRSEFALEAANERLKALFDKFPDLQPSSVQLSMSMENSPLQAGPDLFVAKIFISGGKYSGISVEKSNSNLFVALAELSDHMLETLNRLGDKKRVKSRNKARSLKHGNLYDKTARQMTDDISS
jgi:ribosome-associated translation inhibitor RaiA